MTPERIRLTRAELYERVWATPMRTLAKEFGMSDVGLAKVCRKRNIPVPNTFGNLAGACSPVVTAYVASRFGWAAALTLAATVTAGSGFFWFGVDTRQGITEIIPFK